MIDEEKAMPDKCCDNCFYYNWYWEYCSKWKTYTRPWLVTGCWSNEMKEMDEVINE